LVQKRDRKFFAIEELGFRLNKEFNINSLPLCVSTACTSSTIALGLGLNMIREELADIVIVAGVDVLTEFVFAGFHSLRALSSTFCRPFVKPETG
jgi:3-oxoacyl-(acyl-carrier-protein) synthase